MQYKPKGIPQYNFDLNESVNFYYDFFVASIDGYEYSIKKYQKEIKELLYNQLYVYRFERVNWYINHNTNSLTLQQFRSKIGHLTIIWEK